MHENIDFFENYTNFSKWYICATLLLESFKIYIVFGKIIFLSPFY